MILVHPNTLGITIWAGFFPCWNFCHLHLAFRSPTFSHIEQTSTTEKKSFFDRWHSWWAMSLNKLPTITARPPWCFAPVIGSSAHRRDTLKKKNTAGYWVGDHCGHGTRLCGLQQYQLVGEPTRDPGWFWRPFRVDLPEQAKVMVERSWKIKGFPKDPENVWTLQASRPRKTGHWRQLWLPRWSISGWWFGTRFFYILGYIILGISSSQLTFTPWFFRGVGQPPTRYIYIYTYIYIYPLATINHH